MQSTEVSRDEKKMLMEFLVDYLGIESGEVYRQDTPDEFFVLLKKLIEVESSDKQAEVIKKISEYVGSLEKDAVEALQDFKVAKANLEDELEHVEQEEEADKLIDDID